MFTSNKHTFSWFTKFNLWMVWLLVDQIHNFKHNTYIVDNCLETCPSPLIVVSKYLPDFIRLSLDINVTHFAMLCWA